MRDEVEAATLEEVNAWLEDGFDGASTLVTFRASDLDTEEPTVHLSVRRLEA